MIPGFRRLRRGERCPACSRPDWCLLATTGDRAICPRTSIGAATGKDGLPIKCGDAGWLHNLNGHTALDFRPAPFAAAPIYCIDAPAIHRQLLYALSPAQLATAAADLGVSTHALSRLGIGWSKGQEAFSFPMHDASGAIIGVRLRRSTGYKFAVRGSRNGLFLPNGKLPADDPVLIVEGPTDSAAALDWGFPAVLGRPNSSACVDMTVAAVERQSAVILANHDEEKFRGDGTTFYPGQEGAAVLADALVAAGGTVKVIFPTGGHKDARAWKAAGATRQRVEALIRDTRWWARGGTA